jgi:SAM-dependent methyltransferase/acyl carrier protein
MVFPLAGYLEMILAAVIGVGRHNRCTLTNLEINEALVFFEEEERFIQLMLIPQESETFLFQILGGTSAAEKNEMHTLHVSGKIDCTRELSSPPKYDSLEIVRNRCSDSVLVDEFYQRLRRRSIQHGPMFQGIKQLYRGGSEALSYIQLPVKITDEAQYQIHPALLDIGLQALAAAIPIDADPTVPYIPVSVERFTLYRKPERQLWSHARLRLSQEEQIPTFFEGDIHLINDEDQLVAEIKGLRLQRLEKVTFVERKSFGDFLYQVNWQIKSPINQCFQRSALKFLPSITTVLDSGEIDFDQIAIDNNFSLYLALQAQLEMLASIYILEALQRLGWDKNSKNHVASTDTLIKQLGIVSEQRSYFERLLMILAEREVLSYSNDGWQQKQHSPLPNPETLHASIQAQFNICKAELTLLKRCGENLAQVLNGQCEPLSLLFPDGSAMDIEQMYRQSPELSNANDTIESILNILLKNFPATKSLRILEIGGGTGTTTASLLSLLPINRTEYVFTDLSSQFTNAAEKRFQSYPCISYALLDIEKDPQLQGFANHQFDIIVAANVLHATTDLRRTLEHVRQLLASDGLLVLMEATKNQGWGDLIFGLTEGWWKFSDHDLRPSHPLLSQTQWQQLLQEMSFSEVTTLPQAGKSEPQPLQSVVLARAPQLNTPKISQTNGIKVDLSQQVGSWLIFSDNKGIGTDLANHLTTTDNQSIIVKWGNSYKKLAENQYQIDPANPQNFEQLLEAITKSNILRGIVHLWSLDSPPADQLNLEQLQQMQTRNCGSVLHLIQALSVTQGEPPSLWLVTQDSQKVICRDIAAGVAQAPLWGLARTIVYEHPEFNCTIVDLDCESENAGALLQQLTTDDTEQQIVLRQDGRYVPRLIRLDGAQTPLLEKSPKDKFTSNGTYLITGGLNGLGLEVARWMVNCGASSLALMGRSCPSKEAHRTIADMKAGGTQVHIVQADVTQLEQLAEALQGITESLPPLRGIIHCAGVLNDRVLLKQDWTSFNEVLAPKIYGTWNLHLLTKTAHLDFFTFFASVASLFGAPGQGNHAAANAFEDALAHYRQAIQLPATSINWGAWNEVGIAAQYNDSKQIAARDLGSIAPQQGLTILGQLVENSPPQVSVLSIDPLELHKATTVINQSPLLRDFIRQGKNSDTNKSKSTKSVVCEILTAEDLLSAKVDERLTLLQSYLKCQVSRILRLQETNIQINEPLYQFGLDSLMAIELKNLFEANLKISIPLSQLIEDSTIIQLSNKLLDQFFVVHGNKTTELKSTVLLNNLDHLSDIEVNSMLDTFLTQKGEK